MKRFALVIALTVACGSSEKVVRVETMHPRKIAASGALSMNALSFTGQHASGSTYEYIAGFAPTDDGFEFEIIGFADNPSNADIETWRVYLLDDAGKRYDAKYVVPGEIRDDAGHGPMTPLAGARTGRMGRTGVFYGVYGQAQAGAGDIGGNVANGYTNTGSGPATGNLAGSRKNAGTALYLFAAPRLASKDLRGMTLVVTSESARARFAWAFTDAEQWVPGKEPAAPPAAPPSPGTKLDVEDDSPPVAP